MKKTTKKEYPEAQQELEKENNNFPGYPTYPATEDIYAQWKEEKEINPENIVVKKENEEVGANNVKDFNEDVSGDDLDVPGAELDDIQENIGSEDEENNYFSIGGDNHDNLEENSEK